MKYEQHINKNVIVVYNKYYIKQGKLTEVSENSIGIITIDSKYIKITTNTINSIVLSQDQEKSAQLIEYDDYFANADTQEADKYDLANLRIPENYQHKQHKVVQNITGQKSTFDFNLYTVAIDK
ncbi:Hypothetical_protein [Hexamita inflata]|uniref:Hypothetical_protein n=1 Tax=Hexamita inflata TaxID=28002 RepID=A0AA86RLM0_9EUKA|nr:Hypothetical protein HINF_LOCUS66612 [Hexamita inflata]